MPEDHNGSASNAGQKLKRQPPRTAFRPGFDPRRNLKGRPRSFDQARALAQEIVHRKLLSSDRTVIEGIFEAWAKDPKHQLDLIQYAFGKVPDKLETTGLEERTAIVLHFDHERGIEE